MFAASAEQQRYVQRRRVHAVERAPKAISQCHDTRQPTGKQCHLMIPERSARSDKLIRFRDWIAAHREAI